MKILIYSLPNCVQCDMTKKQFDKAGVSYTSVDLSEDPVAAELVKSMGFTQAPVVATDAGSWSGFKLERIKGIIQAIDAEQAVQSA